MSRKPYRRFASLELEVIWRAIEMLDTAMKHELLAALTQELFVEPHLRVSGPSAREERAVLSLREAAEIVGRSPSIREFLELREQHPEYGWPHASRVRAWLGAGSWNGALERAGLAVRAVDVVVRERVGSAFPSAALITFLQRAAGDLGNSFTFEQYTHWARRPDVMARYGLVARSLNPFGRAFGSWSDALHAAGLREAHAIVDSSGRARSARQTYPRSEIMRALRAAAKALGHTPTIVEYKTFRAKLRQEQNVVLPSASAIRRPFGGDWGAACVAAGLEHPGASATAEFTEDELLGFIEQALADGCTTAGCYDAWRAERLKAAKADGETLRIPCGAVLRKRLGGWKAGVSAAMAREETGSRPAGTDEL